MMTVSAAGRCSAAARARRLPMASAPSELEISWDGQAWAVRPPRALPFDRLFIGKTVEEVCHLAPLIFNICGAAQQASVREAFGLEPDPSLAEKVRDERRRDHARLIGVVLPQLMEVPASTRVVEWPAPEEEPFRDFLLGGANSASLMWRMIWMWPETVGTAQLPTVDENSVWDDAANGRVSENSLAALLAGHDALRWIEAEKGRGPAWRFAARLLDVAAIAHNVDLFDAPIAARGRMFTRGTVSDGIVSAFERLSPTDFLLMPGGLMAQSLEGVGASESLARVLVEIASPCVPWSLTPPLEACHA